MRNSPKPASLAIDTIVPSRRLTMTCGEPSMRIEVASSP